MPEYLITAQVPIDKNEMLADAMRKLGVQALNGFSEGGNEVRVSVPPKVVYKFASTILAALAHSDVHGATVTRVEQPAFVREVV